MALSNAVTLANIASDDALTVDSSNERVGIGSTIPTVALDVDGQIKGDGSLLTNVGFDTSYISGIAATFSGNVNIGGVLTYEDVSNVDSVGLVTAQSGIHVTGGDVLTGTTASRANFGVSAKLQVEATDGSAALSLIRNTNSTSTPPYLLFGKSRGGTVGSNSAVTNGDQLGYIGFSGADGTDLANAGAAIVASVDGTVSNNNIPGRLTLHTTTSGGSPTERLRISSDGTSLFNTSTVYIRETDSTAAQLMIQNSTTGSSTGDGLLIGIDSNEYAYIYNYENTDLVLATNNTERLRFAANGAFGLSGSNYGTAGQVITSNGSGSAPTWQDGGGGGITTEAQVKTTGQTALLTLSSAVDHKVTCTGTVTIDVNGGTQEGESHTLRIVNNGTANVGFSTYFLFPSGSVPSLPTVDGAVSLISFTIHRVGSTGIGTELLAGSSVNFS